MDNDPHHRAATRETPGAEPEADQDRLASALEMAIRERLVLRIGRGPTTNRIAHLLARARLMENAGRALREELEHLDDRGRITAVARAGSVAAESQAEAARLRDAALRLEGEQVGAEDVERYAELAARVRALDGAERYRALGNELVQAVGRIGARGLQALWDEFERVALSRGLVLEEDLARRQREVVDRSHEESRAHVAGEPPGILENLTPPRLLRAADELFERAAHLGRDELFDRIESIAGRLKALQEVVDLDHRDEEILRKAFGVLTRISKEHQPGWTPLLDSRRHGEPWVEYAEAADKRIEDRRRRREQAREDARDEQQREALERFREHERQLVHAEALERLKAALYHYDRVSPLQGADDLTAAAVQEARVQAAIALQSAGGEDEKLEVASALDGHRELVRRGRAYRALRRLWGDEPHEAADDEVAAGEEPSPGDESEAYEIDDAVSGLDRPWGASILECHGAGEGERVLLVGGMPSERRGQMLNEFFGWADLEWQESYRERQADFKALRQRIAAGRFDRVIVLARFCGHDVHYGLREACRFHDVGYHVHPRAATIPAIATLIYGA